MALAPKPSFGRAYPVQMVIWLHATMPSHYLPMQYAIHIVRHNLIDLGLHWWIDVECDFKNNIMKVDLTD